MKTTRFAAMGQLRGGGGPVAPRAGISVALRFALIMALVLGWTGVSFAQGTNDTNANLNFTLELSQTDYGGTGPYVGGEIVFLTNIKCTNQFDYEWDFPNIADVQNGATYTNYFDEGFVTQSVVVSAKDTNGVTVASTSAVFSVTAMKEIRCKFDTNEWMTWGNQPLYYIISAYSIDSTYHNR